MQILPAIDLKDGKCVRLYKGEFSTVHQVADSAGETSERFKAAGAEIIHVVDLDGALSGIGKNREVIKEILSNGMRAELGGGIRTMADIQTAFDLGIYRAIIGSAAVENPEFVREAVKEYGERIAVGIDALGGMVKTRGWTVDSGVDYLEFSKKMEQLGVKTIIFTDIDCDGTLEGPSFDKLFKLKESVSCDIIASGGVTTVDDVKKLYNGGIDGAILGKAIYSGTIDLKAAIKAGKGE